MRRLAPAVRVAIIMLAMLMTIVSCASKEEAKTQEQLEAEMLAQERARAKARQTVEEELGPIKEVKISVWGDEKLNWENSTPHPVVMCVYQLASPGAFSSKAQTAEGIGELLSCSNFDSTVAGHDRYTVQPGKGFSNSIFRQNSAKYLAVVAGFYNPTKGQASAVTTFDNTHVKIYLGKNSVSMKKVGKTKRVQ